MTIRPKYYDLLDQISDKFTVGDGCWEWTASLRGGYPYLKHNNKNLRGHRVLYELLNGPIPEGLELDHLCRNHICVHPSHLEAVTHQVNMSRGHWAKSDATHCLNGHELAGENLRVRYGKRECMTCVRRRDREAQARRRAKKREAE